MFKPEADETATAKMHTNNPGKKFRSVRQWCSSLFNAHYTVVPKSLLTP